jgi:predicted RecA/RadA family phage recombinase
MAGRSLKRKGKKMATKHSEGLRIDYTPGVAVSAGEVIAREDLIGIATTDIAADELGVLDIEGVFDIAKATGSGTAMNAGVIVYWDNSNEVVTETAGGNVYLGKLIEAAAADDETARVKLTP